MGNMKYKAGDRVKVKSLDWYNENKSKSHGTVVCGGKYFEFGMKEWCGEIMTILEVDKTCYIMKEDEGKYLWIDEMIEGLVEEETKPKYEDEVNGDYYSTPKYLVRPSGYQFVDENGNIINATKIVLEKINTLKTQSDNMETETHRGYYTTEEETTNKSKKVAWFTFEDNDFADKVELFLSNRELIQEDGKWFVVKKKKEYPKTYEECCKILGCKADDFFTDFSYDHRDVEISDYEDRIDDLLQNFRKLRYCRDAYWKIAGEEMRLGKPWKNSRYEVVYGICRDEGNIVKVDDYWGDTHIFEFPIREMRDAFKENFDKDLEICKELL